MGEMMREKEYNEHELVYMIQQGDEQSFHILLNLYKPKIRAIIRQNCTYQMTVRNQDIDLFQIGAQALFRAVFEFRENKGIRFTTFSASVIRNALIDFQRSQYRKDLAMNHEVIQLDGPTRIEGAGTVLDQIASQRVEENGAFQIYLAALENAERLLKKRLNEKEYQIYELRNKGYTYREIASMTDVNCKKVENTLTKIRRLLAEDRRKR